MTSTRDESPEAGFHYRLDLDESAVEVDLLRIDPDASVLLEAFGRRGSDEQADSVVVALPHDKIPALTGALMDAYRRGRDQIERMRAADEKRRGGK